VLDDLTEDTAVTTTDDEDFLDCVSVFIVADCERDLRTLGFGWDIMAR